MALALQRRASELEGTAAELAKELDSLKGFLSRQGLYAHTMSPYNAIEP